MLYTGGTPFAWMYFSLCGLVGFGFESTARRVLVINVAIVSALGQTSGLVDESGSSTGGLFGTAVATTGMLSTAAYVLSMGFILRVLGYYTGQPLLGANIVCSMLMFATVSGIISWIFSSIVNTYGGAWDNAKKYIASGVLGVKGKLLPQFRSY